MGHIAPDAVKLLVKKGIVEFILIEIKVYAPAILMNLQKPVARQVNMSM
jgi:hypothetical protein